MNKKRTILVILAMMLVCVLSVAGTVAYLKAETTVVTNTFIAAGSDGPFVDEKDGKKVFEIKEYEVTQDVSGKYTVDTAKEVDANSYTIMPNTDVPKHAFVRLSRTGKTVETTDDENTTTETIAPAPAYLYVEVVNTLDADKDVFRWQIDDANWQALTISGREVYLYKGAHCLKNSNVLTLVADDESTTVDERLIDIIKDDKITVVDSETQISIEEGKDQIKFYAYLCQASVNGIDDPTSVFTTVFPNKPE